MDVKGVGSRYRLHYQVSKNLTSPSYKSKEHNPSENQSGDIISISSKPSFAKVFSDEMQVYKTEYNKGVSDEKISELKEKYAGTNCPVNSTDIANAMMNRVIGL